MRDELVADMLVALGLFGVAADHEAVTHRAVVQHDLLDLQVARNGAVAALARERRSGFLGVAAQLLADDVVPAAALQVAAVLRGLKAAVCDPHDAAELPLAQVVFDLADELLLGLVARPAPHPDRDPRPGDGHPDPYLRQIGAVILGMPVGPKRRRHLAVLVDDRLVGLVGLKVRRGRVEEQQVDLEVQQVGGLPVHALAELLLDLQEPVHRPVARIIRDIVEAVDPGALTHPARRRELRQRLQCAVGDQREQHPLSAPIQPTALQQAAHDGVDPQPAPQPVEHQRAAHRPRLDEPQLRVGRRFQRLTRLEHALQRPDQPHDRVAVKLVLTAEAVDHPNA